MSLHRTLTGLELVDLGIVLTALLALVLLVPTQLGSLILFDSTGLDVLVPDVVFMTVVPALAVALLPTVAARRLYPPRATRAVATIAFVAAAIVAAYTSQFYGMCGPGC
ncbi:MAG TPA: hypothetical protein VKA37_03245 [Halobacteriales archaeon]|nr:hypothetical protein [Halobacteriales archaeon]